MVLNRKLEIAYSLPSINCPRRSCHIHRLESRHSLECGLGGGWEDGGRREDSRQLQKVWRNTAQPLHSLLPVKCYSSPSCHQLSRGWLLFVTCHILVTGNHFTCQYRLSPLEVQSGLLNQAIIISHMPQNQRRYSSKLVSIDSSSCPSLLRRGPISRSSSVLTMS